MGVGPCQPHGEDLDELVGYVAAEANHEPSPDSAEASTQWAEMLIAKVVSGLGLEAQEDAIQRGAEVRGWAEGGLTIPIEPTATCTSQLRR
jgi:hypothetical protein